MISAALLAFAILAPSIEQGSVPTKGSTAAEVRSLLSCRSIGEAERRLACLDQATERVAVALESNALVVISREDAQRSSRLTFGLGGSARNPSAAVETKVRGPERVETRIHSAREVSYGKWLLVLEDGSTWQTTEIDRSLSPGAGEKVVLRKGLLGAYLVAVGRSRELQAKRLR